MKMKFPILALALLALTLAATLLGRDIADVSALLGDAPAGDISYWNFVVFELRLPRVLLALLIGASLASSGVLFQSTLYNPLASPFTLGSSAGAALGAYTAFVLFGIGADSTYILFAFLAALLVSLPVYVLSARKRIPPEAVLLAGVAITFGASALITGLTYVSTESTVFAYARWSLGDLSTIGYRSVLWLVIPTLLPVIYCWAMRHRLDAMVGGEELALARGVHVSRLRSVSILLVTIAVGASVALCGPIAFIGLLVPHMARALVGSNHTKLSLAAPALGASLLIVCDFGSRNLMNVEIPIGVMTASLGTPAFLALLVIRLKKNRV